jgi:hypothetical protein
MNMNRNARELLDRYLLGVRRALPGKKRKDIVAELESTLLDRLDERFSSSNEISESQLKEVLEEMGSPRKVAASYGSQLGLIGPQLFPTYLLVLRIVVPVVVGALTLSFFISAVTGAVITGWSVLEYFGSLWNGAFMAAAWVTLVFAIIERIEDGKEVKELEDLNKFNPDDLPTLDESEKQPYIPGILFEIVMEMLGFAFFIYILSTNGSFPVYINPLEKVGQVRIFTDNYLRFVPGMMAITGLEVIRSTMLLVQGRRNLLTGGMKFLTEIGHIFISALLLGAFPIITVDFMKPFADLTSWNLVQIQEGVNIGLKWILILSIVGSGVGMIKQLIRFLRGKNI